MCYLKFLLARCPALLIAWFALMATSCAENESIRLIRTDTTFDAAPAFVGESFRHGEIALPDLRGHPVVINFWFPSCPPCRAELVELEKAYKQFGATDVEFIGVQQLGLDSTADGQRFLEKLGITFPNIPDINNTIQHDYNVVYYPTTFFIDVNHNVTRKWVGKIERKPLVEILSQLTTSSPTQNSEYDNKLVDR